ncbi:acylneuraminate cytidylyltransferase family protein [Gordonia alkanivorans]|uniref:acylneuraminate cytidylyltransferase family protein n=1 Tax=Gordonia alkanivorans TaxID=84096 RepID=UPI00244A7EF3|nr:acylneuraminate cytidylyltransferase family protein [Gordonia alkanivorans]MDH3052491.1 acylneuraminate cytidylyltransferase family protein [Gordonia alkanivorans]
MLSQQDRELRVVAILPMRHSSERVPGKNYRPLAGKPLFGHVLDMLLTVDYIDRVVIDTDSPTVRNLVQADYPGVLVLERPEHLRSGDTAMNDVLLNTIEQVPADLYLQTHSTNPFLTRETVMSAFEVYQAGLCDSVFSVTPFQARFWSAQLKPMNHDPAVLERTQDLEPIYLENSCLYIFTGEGLREHKNRIGARPGIIEVEGVEAIDIDNEHDFALASAVASSRVGSSQSDEIAATTGNVK